MDSNYEGECATTSSNDEAAGRIKKRRFSSARIQPTRIKKVMQSDEDIGRMVASVPVAIGSSMEHFAEGLLKAAQKCVPQSASKTLSPMHIKLAVMQNPHFQFLEHLVREVDIPKLNPSLSPNSSNERNPMSGDPTPTFFEEYLCQSTQQHFMMPNSSSFPRQGYESLINTSQSAIPHNFFPSSQIPQQSSLEKVSQQQQHQHLSLFNDLTRGNSSYLNSSLLSTPKVYSPQPTNSIDNNAATNGLIKEPQIHHSNSTTSQNFTGSSSNSIPLFEDCNGLADGSRRKRGRPKKDIRFVTEESIKNEPHEFARPIGLPPRNSRNSRSSEEEDDEKFLDSPKRNLTFNNSKANNETDSDRILMPPPLKLPVRATFGNREITNCLTTNGAIDSG